MTVASEAAAGAVFARLSPAPHRHLLIAGTGRAGTSFLVRVLAAYGLDTHLARADEPEWYPDAQAGLEDVPLPDLSADLPYVIKSPWAYHFIGELLADPHVALDAVVIPMRDLMEAATSRSIVEMQTLHRYWPGLAQQKSIPDDCGYTPGGMVYSLLPVDQARILAVGFHRLVERLVQADVPLIFVAFPRIVDDPDYLYDKLRRVLPSGLTREAAREAHARVAADALVRVGRELQGGAPASPAAAASGLERLDNIALRREIVRLRGELAERRRQRAKRGRGLRRLLASLTGWAGR